MKPGDFFHKMKPTDRLRGVEPLAVMLRGATADMEKK
jgi:hypothetical protein